MVHKMSIREGIRTSIQMTPQGKIFLKQDSRGEFMIYKDQVSNIESIIASCKTREEAKEKMHDFKAGYDLHHSNDPRPQTPRRKPKASTLRPAKPKVQSKPQMRIVADSDEISEVH